MTKKVFMVEDDVIANKDVEKFIKARFIDDIKERFIVEARIKYDNMGELKSSNIWFLATEVEEILNEIKEEIK